MTRDSTKNIQKVGKILKKGFNANNRLKYNAHQYRERKVIRKELRRVTTGQLRRMSNENREDFERMIQSRKTKQQGKFTIKTQENKDFISKQKFKEASKDNFFMQALRQ